MFTLEKQTREWERKHPQYTRRATSENAKRYAQMCEQVAAIERDCAVAEQDALCQLGTLGCIDRCGYEDMAYTGEDAHILWLATEDMAEIGWTFDDELLWESL